MKISSFDIFDTCLVRKYGAAINGFDILSLKAFNREIDEWNRQQFVVERVLAQQSVQSTMMTLEDIWNAFSWSHPQLKSKDELCRLEQDLEREMLVPVLTMRDKVNECRKHGDKIIFISDMYLSSDFLIDVMHEHGFYQDGDALYVSCECGAEKRTGELFRYVKEKENLKSFRHWHHYGDNKVGDYNAPKQLGISATLIHHKYTPYQQQWVDNDYSLGFKYPSVLAGLGRALRYSTEWTTHTDFVLDLIAPFYCSLVYRMMKDAEQKGIKRLYFCARDAYMMYKIAQKYRVLFPSIENIFFYISSTALYKGNEEAKIAYYESIGLATKEDNVGIVDIGSCGKTMVYLNQLLSDKGYRTIRGYYFQIFGGDRNNAWFEPNVYYEMNGRYARHVFLEIVTVSHFWEKFFPLNTLQKTVDYTFVNGQAIPVFGSDQMDNTPKSVQFYIEDDAKWSEIHEKLLLQYTDIFIHCGLANFADKIFPFTTSTLLDFINRPIKSYLPALECLHGWMMAGWVPYVKKSSPVQII